MFKVSRPKLNLFVALESGRLEFEEFVTLAAKFIVEEDDEAMQKELKEAFRLYDKEGEESVNPTIDNNANLSERLFGFWRFHVINNLLSLNETILNIHLR